MAEHVPSTGVAGTTPVASLHPVALPVHEKARARATASTSAEPVAASEGDRLTVEVEATPKQSRKAKLTSGTAASGPPLDFAALGLDPEQAKVAEGLRVESLELGRKSTSTVFEWGRLAAVLRGLAQDQEHFAKLAEGVLKLSRTGAENYQRVHQHLTPFRERLEAIGMIASGLYNLATAEPEKVEEVLAAGEAGQKLTGARIKAMLGKASAPAVSPDDGGPGGLKAAVAEKTAFAVKLFLDTLYLMLRDIHVVLEPHCNGGKVTRSKAEAALMHPARLAGGLVESLVYAAQIPGGRVPAGVIHVLPVSESRWVELRRILDVMGSSETLPKADKLGAWLETVVPEFEWALGSERAEKARAVLEEQAAAAEAARVEAEKAKERAKAEQKKAREKAKREKLTAEKRAAREARAAAKLPPVAASTLAQETSSAIPAEA